MGDAMTDEQFKKLMDKLDEMQRQMDAGKWFHGYPIPSMPAPIYVDPRLPFNPPWPIITD